MDIFNYKEKAEARAEWEKKGPEREAERLKRGIPEIVEDDEEHYTKRLAEVIALTKMPDAPQMQVLTMMSLSKMSMPSPGLLTTVFRNRIKKAKARQKQQLPEHQDKIINATGAEACRAMIHPEISIAEAMQIQEGKDAMNEEWNKLEFPIKDDQGNVKRPAAWDVM